MPLQRSGRQAVPGRKEQIEAIKAEISKGAATAPAAMRSGAIHAALMARSKNDGEAYGGSVLGRCRASADCTRQR